MDQYKNINTVTLLLALVAGYCDTLTFVAADNIFSAHVTGNFIVFAYQIVTGADLNAWIKLITFPVFIMAVMAGGWIASNNKPERALLAETVLLLLAGILAFIFHLDIHQQIIMYPIVLIIVVAMGMQNAFGKLYAKATHGPTTMMTGNVTQASLDLRSILLAKNSDEAIKSLKKQSITIGSFLTGCFLGGLLGREYGLSAILIAGILMAMCYFYQKQTN
jgi:uncharacterized membrane protein YoaK (UPF0700 family)